jgi:hypothetical protein
LRELGLASCGDIPDLSFVEPLKNLRDVAIVDTTIVDGDLSLLDHLPAMRHRYVTPRKHYNRKFVDVAEL